MKCGIEIITVCFSNRTTYKDKENEGPSPSSYLLNPSATLRKGRKAITHLGSEPNIQV